MDLLKRHKGYTTRILITGMVLLALAAVLILFGLSARDQGDPVELTALNEGEYGYLDLHGLAGPFAVNEGEGEYYYIGWLESEALVVVDIDPETHTVWQGYITDSSAWDRARPVRVEGRVRSAPAEIRRMAQNAYMEMSGDPIDSETLTTYLSTTKLTGASTTWMIVGIFVGVFALMIVIIGLFQRRRVKNIRDLIQTRYPYYDDFHFLEQQKDFDLPSLKLFLKDDLLFSELGGLSLADLRDTGWLYLRIVRRRRIASPYLFACSKTRKNKKTVLPLSDRGPDTSVKLQPLLHYVAEQHPSILIGYSPENKKKYRALFNG